MGLFDVISKGASAVTDWGKDNWDTLAVGAASVAGFAVGGPLGAALAGAAVGGITAKMRNRDPLAGAVMGGLGGVIGGIGGVALRTGVGAAGRTALSNFSGRSFTALTRGHLGGAGIRGSVGGYFRSVQRQIPARIAGSLGAGVGAALGYGQEFSGWSLAGGGEEDKQSYGEIPISPIGDPPDGMNQVYMPDGSSSSWPQDLAKLSPPMQSNCEEVPGICSDLWRSFGKKPSESDLPKKLEVHELNQDQVKAANIQNYEARVDGLKERFTALRLADAQVAKAVKRTEEYCEAGRADLNSTVSALKQFVGIHPYNLSEIGDRAAYYAKKVGQNGSVPSFTFTAASQSGGAASALGGKLSEDNYMMHLLESMYASTGQTMGAWAEKFQALANEIKPPPDSKTPPTKKTPTTTQTPPTTQTPTTPQGPTMPQSPTTPQTPKLGTPPTLDLTDPSKNGSKTGTDGRNSAARDALGNLGKSGSPSVPSSSMPSPTPTPTPTPTATPGSGLESMMLPMIMQSMMGAMANANQQRARQQQEDELRRRDKDRDHSEQMPIPAPTPQASPTAPPASAPPATNQSGPGSRVSAPPSSAAPVVTGKQPASEDNVVYTFPDGRTQEVSAVVARALDAAFGNAAGTDAQAAYANTSAKWTDIKKVGTRVDPYQLMTGDVGVWEGRNALLVVFGTETSGTLEAVVDGQLQPVAGLAEMRDGEGEFGPFIGFFHPPGIEKKASSAPEVPGAQTPPTTAADQAVAAAPV